MQLAAAHFWGDGADWPAWMTDEQRDDLTNAFSDLSSRLFKTKAFLVGFAMTVAHVERKLDESERSDFWQFCGDSLVVQKLCHFFRHSNGFLGANAHLPRQQEWVAATPKQARFAGMNGDSYYGFIRQTFSAPLQDGLWQIPKYWFIEVLACRQLEDLHAAENAWKSKAIAQGASEATASRLAERVSSIAADAARTYRWRFLLAHFAAALERWRRDNVGLELSQPQRDLVWRETCETLAKQLERSFKTPPAEISEIREFACPGQTSDAGRTDSDMERDTEIDTDTE
jgi:hypothetical protein